MEFFFILVGLAVFLVFPLWVVIRLSSQKDELFSLRSRLSDLESQIHILESRTPSARFTDPSAPPAPSQEAKLEKPKAPIIVAAVPATLAPDLTRDVAPPILPPTEVIPPPMTSAHPAAPPPLPERPLKAAATEIPTGVAATTAPPPPAPRMNWEQFMGVKLFAWLGGLALFLGAVFFIKLSIEEGWISPELRVALGFLLGVGLIAGGVILAGKRFAVTAQTLCATGVVTLYAMTFASHSVYGYFSSGLSFGLMIAITAIAFALALRLDAKVVAVLGLLGGFLTPILLSTGQENTVGLFAYITFLDTGLLAVALVSGWRFLVPLAALGTVVMQMAWGSKFLREDTMETAAGVACLFDFLFLGGAVVAWRRRVLSPAFSLSVAGLVLYSFGLAADLGLDHGSGLPMGQWLAFLGFADLCVLAVVALGEEEIPLSSLSGGAVFVLLGAWTAVRLTDDLQFWALGAYLGYAVLHSLFPLALQHWQPRRKRVAGAQIFPLLTLVLLLGPTFFRLHGTLALWPVVLILDALIIAVAARTRSVASIISALVLTLIIAGSALLQLPSTEAPDVLFLVIAGFALLFFAVGLRLKFQPSGATAVQPDPQISAYSALLPFALLVLASSHLSLSTPHALFAVALLLVLMALGSAYLLGATAMPILALIGVLLVAETWSLEHFPWNHLSAALGWYAVFYALFTTYPFFGYNRFREKRGPWFASAFAGPAFFWLTYSLLARARPGEKLGWLPAVLALPPLVAAWVVTQKEPMQSPRRLERLALYVGMAGAFVALIFPIQFQRQWITTGWAIEGMALLWIFRSLPHRGLAAFGTALLVAAFVRLAVNPAVFSYQLHAATPIFNGYLSTYGIATACLIVGARLASSPPLRLSGIPVALWLNLFAGFLLFLLINIEIADYFSPGRTTLTFEFTGNFARDMAYTVSWAIYALALLVVGIWRKARGCRYAAVGLLTIALGKLFLHDLAQLAQLYRVGALVGVAAIAFLASVLYQRFIPGEKPRSPD